MFRCDAIGLGRSNGRKESFSDHTFRPAFIRAKRSSLLLDRISVQKQTRLHNTELQRKWPKMAGSLAAGLLRARRPRKRFEIHRIDRFPNRHQLAIRLLHLEERGFRCKRVHSEATSLHMRLSCITKHAADCDVQ